MFSHGSHHSRGVCILINPLFKDYKVLGSFTDDLGRIVLINVIVNCLELSLCNIYAPNNRADQLQFIARLNNWLIDKSELTSLIYHMATVSFVLSGGSNLILHAHCLLSKKAGLKQ